MTTQGVSVAEGTTDARAERAGGLPNAQLIRELYQDYYLREPAEQAPYVSSHWGYGSQRFQVEFDEGGRLRVLRGYGIAGVVTGYPGDRLAAKAFRLFTLLTRPGRGEMVKLLQTARRVCGRAGFDVLFDGFEQLYALAFLRQWLGSPTTPLTILVIGDGYGFLSAMLKHCYPDATVVLVDIGRTLLFQSVLCQRAHPDARHYGITKGNFGATPTLADYDFIYCPTEYLDVLRALRYDVAITISAMQEMNAATIERYFAFLRDRLKEEHLFYCCGRVSKVLRGGEVSTFDAYPWDPRDRHLVDGRCPWYGYYGSLRTSGPGLRLFGMRVPFVNAFHPMRHRLSLLATSGRAAARASARASG